MKDTYRILVCHDDTNHRWHDCGEGPFDTPAEAIEFASNEVGVAWVVVDPCDAPVAFGDWSGKAGEVDHAQHTR